MACVTHSEQHVCCCSVVTVSVQFPRSLSFVDLRYKLGGFPGEKLTSMFQELGRMARYTAGESMHTLPIAFLHDGTLRELKKRLDTHTALQSMKMKVCGSPGHCMFVVACPQPAGRRVLRPREATPFVPLGILCLCAVRCDVRMINFNVPARPPHSPSRSAAKTAFQASSQQYWLQLAPSVQIPRSKMCSRLWMWCLSNSQ